MRFEDRVAIITGGAGGIGSACAEEFAKEGARVVLADVNEARGREVAEDITAQHGRQCLFVLCDVGDHAQVENLLSQTVSAFGGVDILINNAGFAVAAPFLEVREDDFERVLRTNLKGAFLVGQAVARQMVTQGRGGAIINMSSVNAVLGLPNQMSYAVSKGGINQLTKSMALALIEHGIRVNAIGPGTIATEPVKRLMSNEKIATTIRARTPIGRLGEPAEVARLAVFLASDDASYIIAQTIYPDGGRLAQNFS